MNYLIDGYNLFFHLYQEQDPCEENKYYFVSHLCELMIEAKKSGEMVFDTPIHHHTDYAHTKINPPLIISYAPSGLEADDLIIEKLYALKDTKSICVVSSDRELVYRAKECDVKSISCEKFMSMLRKRNRTKAAEKKSMPHHHSYHEKLEEIFTKKLNQIDE